MIVKKTLNGFKEERYSANGRDEKGLSCWNFGYGSIVGLRRFWGIEILLRGSLESF